MREIFQAIADRDFSKVMPKVLPWVPMVVASVLVLCAVLAILGTSLGHGSTMQQQRALTNQKQHEAVKAEKDAQDAYDKAVQSALNVNAARVTSDELKVKTLVAVLLENPQSAAASTTLSRYHVRALSPMVTSFLPSLQTTGVPGLGLVPAKITRFDPQLIGMSGNTYNYFSVFEVAPGQQPKSTGPTATPTKSSRSTNSSVKSPEKGAVLTMTYSTDASQNITDADAHWSTATQRS